MNMFRVFILFSIYCSIFVLVDGVNTSAQAAKSADYRLVSKSCVPEVARFCPASVNNSSASRGQAICLKPYLSSLSLGCRRAVKAIYQ